jgi:hypothetical protein
MPCLAMASYESRGVSVRHDLWHDSGGPARLFRHNERRSKAMDLKVTAELGRQSHQCRRTLLTGVR